MAVDRVATFGTHKVYLARLMDTQKKVNDLQVQVASTKKSQDYIGLAKDANRLINMENELANATAFKDQNTVTNTQLGVMKQSLDGALTTIRTFQTRLDEFATNDMTDVAEVATIQEEALRTMIELQTIINGAQVDGQYLFAGGRVTTAPVDWGYSDLASFQAKWDGRDVQFPTGADAHMQDLTLTQPDLTTIAFAADGTVTAVPAGAFAQLEEGATITISGTASNNGTFTVFKKIDSSNISLSQLETEGPTAVPTITYKDATNTVQTLTNTDYTTLTFSPTGDTITGGAGLAVLPVGQVFTVAGSTSNDGTYQVKTNAAGLVTIESLKPTVEAAVAGTITATSWYKGDSQIIEKRVEESRAIETGLLASNTAFEKAFRAMAIIAQGTFGTAGGLDQNTGRVDDARYLLRDAQASPASGTPPYGTETRGDITTMYSKVSWNEAVVDATKKRQTLYAGFLESRSAEIEDVDITEASIKLSSEVNLLEASYATLAKVRQLTILDYLK
ncbi:MAG: hypothetical protein HY985_03995 [Magnetospirillum sp.]|nr:hypothetical protein [Magnetospirillum sp.]